MNTKLWNRLSIRLIATISIVLISILSIYTYISINNFESYLTRNSIQNANNINDLIKKSARYSMFPNGHKDVYQIINHHYGNIKVENTSLHGTAFKMEFPQIINS